MARRKALAILLLVALFLVALTVYNRFPSDAAVDKHFRKHEAEFEELVLLIESAYRGVGSLYSFDDYGDYSRAQPRYTELMAAVGVSRSPVTSDFRYSCEAERRLRDPRPAAISFVLDTLNPLFGNGFWGEDKGIVFFPVAPSFDHTHILVPNTAKAEMIYADYLIFYRQIEGNWYIYRFIES